MIFFDNFGHMISDGSVFEFYLFACDIGAPPCAYQHTEKPHYLITNEEAERARKAGAIQVTPQELVQKVRSREAA